MRNKGRKFNYYFISFFSSDHDANGAACIINLSWLSGQVAFRPLIALKDLDSDMHELFI